MDGYENLNNFIANSTPSLDIRDSLFKNLIALIKQLFDN